MINYLYKFIIQMLRSKANKKNIEEYLRDDIYYCQNDESSKTE